MSVSTSFFELLQVAVGNREELSCVPTPEEWEEIYEMSKKQSVAGIAFAGVERLPQEQMPPGRRIRQWAVKAEKTREHNAKVSEDCRVISRFFEENGFDCVILKGQGNFAYYPEWLQGLRSAGDIDIWCWPKANANETHMWCYETATPTKRGYATTKTKRPSDYENEDKVQGTKYKVQECKNLLNQREARLEHPVRRVIEFCQSKKRGEYVYYHNLDFPVLKKTPVEVHYRPTWLYNPFRNRVLQKWFGQFTALRVKLSGERSSEHNSQFTVHNSSSEALRRAELGAQFTVYDGYRIPSVEFNVVFQLLHLYKHIFEEGIGLRQLLDYYFVINETQSEIATKRGCATTKTKRPSDYENWSNNKDNKDNQDDIIPLNPSTLELIGRLGLRDFAGAVMYVMREVFAMPEEWMLYKPDEKRGKKLLEEIMIGGNFGKFDERYNWAETTNGSMDYRGASYAFARLRHNFQFLSDYPSEVLWEPVFRVYHWFWRKCRLWRWE
ncbi:MAG: nucleotidyltransferase family protein [Prevotella sp.]|nr:nucleotidyltransferase family protein [Prevotella sp.]